MFIKSNHGKSLNWNTIENDFILYVSVFIGILEYKKVLRATYINVRIN